MERNGDVNRWLGAMRSHRKVALDTNAVVYILDTVQPYSELLRHLLGLMERGLMAASVSTIVEAEVLVKPLRDRDRRATEMAQLFFRETPNLRVQVIDRTISAAAASIRANTRLTLPDAIIAATAVADRCDAIIGNDRTMAERVTGIPYLCLDDYVV